MSVQKEKVVLDFYSDSCGPCKLLARDLEDILNDFEHFKVQKLDIMENYELTEKYNVMSVPTLVVLDDTNSTYVGYKGKEDLVNFFKNVG